MKLIIIFSFEFYFLKQRAHMFIIFKIEI